MPVNLFDANFYRAANSDLAAAGLTTDAQLLSHFQNSGIAEGRLFSPFANLNFYRSSNSDLLVAGLNSNRQLYEHLQNFGVAEGRRFSPFADINFYLAANSDVAQAFENNREQAFRHLQNNGAAEGRIFSPFANVNYYLASNPDVAQAFGNNRVQALQHLEINGVNEGRLFSVPFDVNYYRSVNSDLTLGLNNQQLLEHFEINGLAEGRTSSPFFNISYYLANNSDLSAAGLNNRQGYDHFVLFGLAEGRSANGFTSGDYAGNTLDTARNIAVEGISTTFRDAVGSSDAEDFYRFTINADRIVSLLLDSLNADVNIRLFQDFNDDGIFGSFNPGTTPESLSTTLVAGTYYIRVYSADGANTNYNLTLSATPTEIPEPITDLAGNTLLAARDIGTLSGTLSFSDFVGSADSDDFYRFSLNTESNSNLLLNGLSADADIEVIQDFNNNGEIDDEVIESSANSDTMEESISRILAAGTYYIRVYPFEGDTNYNLTLSATPT